MYAKIGEPHPGFDCFIFKRKVYPKYVLYNVCIGVNWVGKVLLWNLEVFSRKFKVFTDVHLTFHIGNDQIWKNRKYVDYVEHNKNEAKKIYLQLQRKNGNFKDEKYFALLGS